MQISSSNLNIKKNSSSPSFCGLREVLGAYTVKAFLNKVQKIGDVVILKKTYEKGKLKLTPTKVALVKCKLTKKAEKDSKVFFGLFEPNYSKAITPEELDAAELGLVEVKYKNLKGVKLSQGTKAEIQSVGALTRVYNEGLKILHLISYEGDKYKGIGTALLDTVFEQSKQMKLGGKVFLYAKNLFPQAYLKKSNYCTQMAKSTPTQFYYNYGFRADNATNELLANKSTVDGFTMHLPLSVIRDKLSKNK